MQLRDWQYLLQEKILTPTVYAVDFSLLYAAVKSGVSDQVTRFGIYQDAYRLRLTEALRSNFPALHQLLGDDDFDVMASRFIADYPPDTASIRWFGNSLAIFLAEENPYCQQPVFSELAQFEWALRHALDAGDAEMLSPQFLQSIAADEWPALVLQRHPSITLLHFNWTTPLIWKALDANAAELPMPEQKNSHWLVYRRPDLVSSWRSLDAVEYSLLNALLEPYSLADLCELLQQQNPDNEQIPQQLAAYLRSWTEVGLVQLVNTKESRI